MAKLQLSEMDRKRFERIRGHPLSSAASGVLVSRFCSRKDQVIICPAIFNQRL